MLKKSILALAAVTALWTGTACAEEYYMRPGDELNIVVTQQQDLGNSSTNQSPFVVRPDGNVSFPLVGEIHAEGMTVSQFTDVLQQGLARYIVDPDVSVNISKLGRVRVYVFGEVRQPGAVELEKGHTVIDAIGAAQGFTRPGIAVFALIFVEPYRLFVITQTPGQWMRLSSTNYSFHLYCSSRSGIASGVRWL